MDMFSKMLVGTMLVTIVPLVLHQCSMSSKATVARTVTQVEAQLHRVAVLEKEVIGDEFKQIEDDVHNMSSDDVTKQLRQYDTEYTGRD